MKKIFISAVLALSAATMNADNWNQRFRNPDKAAKPWTFWYWMFGNVSDEGIRLDLEAMKHAGISGFYLMPIKSTADGKELGGASEQLSPEWWRRMDTVYRLADSLRLDMGIHFSDGFALGGGPWIEPEESMQKIVWSDTIVSARDIRTGKVPVPRVPVSGYYEDIATYIYPVEAADARKPKASVEFPFRATEPSDIIMTYDAPYTLRSVRIVTGGNNIQSHRFSIYASDDGVSYRFVRQLQPARQGWQNTDAQATYAVPPTTAKYFKFHWTPEGSDPGSEDMDAAKWKPTLKVGAIEMSSAAVIDGYEGKSGLVWRVPQPFGVADADCVKPENMIILTPNSKLNTQNSTLNTQHSTLNTQHYRVLRIGHASTLHTNATGGGGRGLECDKFSRAAIQKQINHWFGAIYSHASADVAKRVLKRLHVDSWECGCQNWSSNFAAEFRQRRGYDIMPWLPLMAGVPMESSEKSDAVLRDVRLTIAELIEGIFFDEVQKAARRHNVSLSTECVAPTMVSDGLLHYKRSDYPMGEFWLNSPTHDKPNDMLDAISGAHIYNKNIIQAEGFTEIRGVWDEHPAMLRPLLDANYCMGINAIVFHVMTHNPFTDRKPGMTLDGIGTFFQRDNTWWREMPAFTEYIARSQALLQHGSPVVDLAVYTGDELPRRSILPERLAGILGGLYDKGDLEREKIRVANVGQPMEQSPVGVNHTKNMTKADTWVNPLRGYHYDSFNHDVLDGSSIKDGRLITPDGMKYEALVVPGARLMNPAAINTAGERIEALRRQGLKVIDKPWTADDLSALGIQRDAQLPRGIAYTHRHAEDADIYMLSNQTDNAIAFIPQFRARRSHAYIADAIEGKIYRAADLTDPNGNISLAPKSSLFYVLADSEVTADTPTAAGTLQPLEHTAWTVEFEETGKTVTSDTLFDWSRSSDNAVKYYSGHATYTTTFKAKKNERIILDLGDVRDIATVTVNGTDCGTLWTAPFRTDITKALRKGKNELKITVVNTWANGLLGSDLGTPAFDGIWTNAKFRRAEKTTIPAGMLGPVRKMKNEK